MPLGLGFLGRQIVNDNQAFFIAHLGRQSVASVPVRTNLFRQ